MFSSLKTIENSMPVIIEPHFLTGKTIRKSARAQQLCPKNTISVDRYMALYEDPDMLELIRSRPKLNNHQRVGKSGPSTNAFGIDPDSVIEQIPGALRTQGQKLGSMTAREATPFVLKNPKEKALYDKLFKDHLNLNVCVGFDPKNKKNPRNNVRNRGTKKIDHLVTVEDLTLGKRVHNSDRRVLRVLKDHIVQLHTAVLNYTKEAKGDLNMEKIIKEHKERIDTCIKNLSKTAKGRDLVKELLKERNSLVLSVQKHYKVIREQKRLIKLREQKRRLVHNTTVKPKHVTQTHKDLAEECIKDEKYVDQSVFSRDADLHIPRPCEMSLPVGFKLLD